VCVHPDQGPGRVIEGVSVTLPEGRCRQDRQDMVQEVASVALCGECVGVQCEQMFGAVLVETFKMRWIRPWHLLVAGRVDPAFEGDRERIERWLPPHCPSCLTAAGGV
jgi:hypothetical protein